MPNAILPASVALSSTSRRGARPIRSKTALRPRQKTSALSHGRAAQKRALECGSVTTRSFRSTVRPATVAREVPEVDLRRARRPLELEVPVCLIAS